MAIYHLTMKAYRRSKGHSATAAAAYRTASMIIDERTGVVHDYSRKGGVAGSHLFLPGGRVEDRAEFWNRIEKHHKRGDAVMAREIEMSLPHELTDEKRKELAVKFAEYFADKYGVAVDAAIHGPGKDSDERNHHVHLLISACSVGIDGNLGKKVNDLDPIHCQRNEGVENTAELERPIWEEMVNTALAKAKIDARVDHRSLKDQGITDRLPGKHLGPATTAMIRREEVSRKAEAFQQEQEEFEQALALELSIQAEIKRLKVERERIQQSELDALLSADIEDEPISWRGSNAAKLTGQNTELIEPALAPVPFLVLFAPTPISILSLLTPELFIGFTSRMMTRRRDGEEYKKFERRDEQDKVVESVAVFKDEIQLYEHEDIEASVSRMIVLALQNGWKIEDIKAKGSVQFVLEAERQIAGLVASRDYTDTLAEYKPDKTIDGESADAAIEDAVNSLEQEWKECRGAEPQGFEEDIGLRSGMLL